MNSNKFIFFLPKPSDRPFYSPASYNVISIAGIHFAYIRCCYVGQSSDKLCSRQEQPFVNRVCMKFEYITKVPYYTCGFCESMDGDVMLTAGKIRLSCVAHCESACMAQRPEECSTVKVGCFLRRTARCVALRKLPNKACSTGKRTRLGFHVFKMYTKPCV